MATLELDRAQTEDLRDQAYQALRAALPPANLDAAMRCSARLAQALPQPGELAGNLVMVAYGGGKDSSYTLAFVRAIQLILHRVYGVTFRLRVATNRHAGMPQAVLDNISRAYQALRLTEDPDCELLLIDGNEVTPFSARSPQRQAVVGRNRLDILMTGHRTFADGRPTFCNACNLSVVNSFGLAAAYGDGADLIITGDSLDEQRAYTLWVGRLGRRLAPARRPEPGKAKGNGISRLLSAVDGIAEAYFTDIHGPGADELIAERRVMTKVPDRLKFFSIYPDTAYAAGDHMQMLTGFLGFQFDELAFSFTESDCGNPALMAHLRGLKCERVYERSYAEGMAEYVSFALGLMRTKDYPAELIDLMRARYEGPGATERMRQAAAGYALSTFGLAEEQLVCMAYSPFAGQGAGLDRFLEREHPGLADRAGDIRSLLSGAGPDPSLSAELERISGLELARLQVLYRRPVWQPGSGPGSDVINTVLAGDPHKAVIRTSHTRNGPAILEQISGR
jgi:hypothetical protein